jgi:hypothetical protein
MPSQSMSAEYAGQVATWFDKGYAGQGNVADLLDSLRGRPAIVAGSGHGVFAQVDEAKRALHEPLVFAANDVAVLLPHVDHMVSLHTPKLDLWVELRRDPTSKGYGNRDFQVHDGGLYGERLWHQWTGLTPTMALSGYFAMQIAYLMGCAPIVLCGCPGDMTPCFWQTEPTNADYARISQTQIIAEMGFKPEFKKVVRSMSGWSREYFGQL